MTANTAFLHAMIVVAMFRIGYKWVAGLNTYSDSLITSIVFDFLIVLAAFWLLVWGSK